MDAARLIQDLRRLLAVVLPSERAVRGPIRARVTAVREPGGRMSELEPRYSVNVQPLDRDGNDHPDWPELPDVALPVLWAGSDRGLYCVPEVGSIVRLGFEYCDVNRPYIDSITGEGWDAPAHEQGRLLLRSGDTHLEISAGKTIAIRTKKASVVVKPDGAVEVDGTKVRLCGPGGGVVTSESPCMVTGIPHESGSTRVEAGL
jgi:hypothetical protein